VFREKLEAFFAGESRSRGSGKGDWLKISTLGCGFPKKERKPLGRGEGEEGRFREMGNLLSYLKWNRLGKGRIELHERSETLLEKKMIDKKRD